MWDIPIWGLQGKLKRHLLHEAVNSTENWLVDSTHAHALFRDGKVHEIGDKAFH